MGSGKYAGLRCPELRKTLRVEKRAEVYTGKPCPHGHGGTRYARTGQCVGCTTVAYGHAARRDSPENKHRRSYRFRNCGLDLEAFNALLKSQKGNCAICSEPVTEENRNLHLDHCHASMKVRGILCRNCNLGIGYFKDDPEKLKKAIAYIERHANV